MASVLRIYLGQRNISFASIPRIDHATLINERNALLANNPNHPELAIQDYTEIGSGSFGKVLSSKTPQGDMTAIKVFFKQEFFKQEVEIFKRIKRNHPLIIRMLECTGPDAVPGKISFPLYVNRSLGYQLQLYLDNIIKYSFNDVFGWTLDILHATSWLHEVCNIAHLDIKPENILLDEKYNAVLADLGCSLPFPIPNGHAMSLLFCPPEFRYLAEKDGILPNGEPLLPVGANNTMHCIRQTANYDTFSIGVTLILLLLPAPPTRDNDAKIDEIVYKQAPLVPTITPKPPGDFIAFVKRMINLDWLLRPTPSALLQHMAIRAYIEKYPKKEWQTCTDALQEEMADMQKHHADELTNHRNAIAQLNGAKMKADQEGHNLRSNLDKEKTAHQADICKLNEHLTELLKQTNINSELTRQLREKDAALQAALQNSKRTTDMPEDTVYSRSCILTFDKV